MLPLFIVATRNAHKTEEIRQMLHNIYEVKDLSFYPETSFVEETGTTFLENASLKAVAASTVLPGIILADDSGLEVDALNGRPGVYSSSFGGEEGNHALNNQRMIAELTALNNDPATKFPARFLCTMVLAREGIVLGHVVGSVEGHMITSLQGENGFGYDPLFVPEGYTQTFAQLGNEIKNTLSHRGRALTLALNILKSLS